MSIVHHICWYNNLDVRRYVLCISLSDRFRTRFWTHITLWDLVINLFIQFWKSVQVIEQKHESNYNRLHFLIYLLHILRSISTDFSLLQER